MTRINVIEVKELSRQHLVAEYRELPRIYAFVEKAVARGLTPDTMPIPAQYTLGKGHMYFFANKLTFIRYRQRDLIAEMKRRGYKTAFEVPSALDILARIGYLELMQDYKPTVEAIALNRQRIKERTI